MALTAFCALDGKQPGSAESIIKHCVVELGERVKVLAQGTAEKLRLKGLVSAGSGSLRVGCWSTDHLGDDSDLRPQCVEVDRIGQDPIVVYLSLGNNQAQERQR